MSETLAPAKSKAPVIAGLAIGIVGLCLCVAVAVAAYFIVRNLPGKGAQPTIEYILDASPRMNSKSSGGDTRIGIARGVLGEIVRTADPRLTAGLRVFGAGAESEGCQDTNLVVPLAVSNQVKIAEGLGDIAPAPESDSPLAEAMIAAIRDVAETKGPHSIIVVTGGADSCNPESGELIQQEAERAGVELKMFVVGLDVSPEEAVAIRAMVAMIPGATYKDAPDATGLRSALTTIQAEVNRQAEEDASEPPPAEGSETACDHPYLPLRSGSSWTYSTTEGTSTWSVGSAAGTADSAQATMTISVPEVTMTTHWTCTSAGIISYDFGNISVAQMGQVVSMDVTDSSGVFLPAASLLAPGYSWSDNYTLVMHVTAEGISLDTTMSAAEAWTAVGMETVSVPAGTFEAMRVEGTENISMSGFMGMEGVDTVVQATFWFAEGVGIVRYSSESGGYSSVGELASYTIP